MASPVRLQVRRTDTTTGALTTAICGPSSETRAPLTIYCFENPYVDSVSSDRVDWET